VAGFVVGVEDGAVDAAADLNPLPEGVVDGSFGGGAVGQGSEAAGVVVGGGDGGIAGGVGDPALGLRRARPEWGGTMATQMQTKFV
jgi:hypothetical protein